MQRAVAVTMQSSRMLGHRCVALRFWVVAAALDSSALGRPLVQRTFVVNRPTDADRRLSSGSQLAALQLEPRFVSAPVSENTGLPDAKARVRACYLSHRAVWSEVAVSWEPPDWHNFGREGAGWTLIFEDDVMVHPNTSIRELNLILQTTAHAGIDLVQLLQQPAPCTGTLRWHH